jgi:Family of unknown function (DUF5684)
MPIEVSCPSCGAKLKVPEKFARRGLVCFKCQHEFRLPADIGTTASAPQAKAAAPPKRAEPTLPAKTPRAVPRQSVQRSAPQPTSARRSGPPSEARTSAAAPIARVPLPSEYWDEDKELEVEPGPVPPRVGVGTRAKPRKGRASAKRGGGKSDWPFYAIGFVCFGPLLLLIPTLFIWNNLARASTSAKQAPAAVAENGNAANGAGPAQAAVQPVAAAGAVAPPNGAGDLAAQAQAQAPGVGPPAQGGIAEGGANPSGQPAAPPRTSVAAELRKRQMQRMRALREEAADRQRRMMGAIQAIPLIARRAGPPVGAQRILILPGQPINPAQPALPFAANDPDPAVQAAGRNPSADSAAPSLLDPYLSRGQQGALAIVVTLWWLAMIVYLLAGVGATFAKAGKPAWGAFVPLYNIVLLFDIAGISLWWALLILVPFVNLLVVVLLAINIAENFGKSVAFGVGLGLLGPVFYPVLGFGGARYKPPRARLAYESF